MKDKITFCPTCHRPVWLGPYESIEACSPDHPGSPGHVVAHDPPAYVERAVSFLTGRPIGLEWPAGVPS